MTDGGGFKVYSAESTSRRTAVFEPVEIWLRGERDGPQKRLVLKVQQVDDPSTEGATLHAALVYQFRRKADADWSENNFSLASLKAGEEVRMDLHANEVLKIFEELGRLYQATGVRVQYGRYSIAVGDPDMEIAAMPKEAADEIRALLEAEGPAVLETIARLRPQWATWAALAEDHRQRAADLAEFEMHLAEDPPIWDEHDWQAFFRRAPWIFGHGLNYTFLVNEQAEADYGGQDLGGSGGERGDELMRTAGQFRFAVLVELKKPDTALIAGSAYRNGAWRIGTELAGGVAQLQANCERIREAAAKRENVRWLDEREMTVADPQGILVVGHTRQLIDDARRESFHRFRRNLWNPTVLTYDELLERARFLVGKAATRVEEARTDTGQVRPSRPDDEPDFDDRDNDDLPF